MEKTNQPKIINDYEMNKIVAENIIKMIEEKNIKQWRKTWSCKPNTLTDLYYKVLAGDFAVSIFTTELLTPEMYGLAEVEPGFYLTFKDIKNNSLKLKKGSKGVATYKPSIFEKFLTIEQYEIFKDLLENPEKCEDEAVKSAFIRLATNPYNPARITFTYGDNKKFDELVYLSKSKCRWVYKRFMYVLTYYFNNKDLEKPVDVKRLWQVSDKEYKPHHNKRIEIAEQVKKSYIERAKLDFNEIEQDQAYYKPATHSVVVPKLDQFEDTNKYYQTLFHEFAHSTGHRSLLNRNTLTAVCGFGSTTYSKEELVAELSSTFTLNSLGLLTDEIITNSIAYLAGWGSKLKEGIRHNILATITNSQKATNLILNIQSKENI